MVVPVSLGLAPSLDSSASAAAGAVVGIRIVESRPPFRFDSAETNKEPADCRAARRARKDGRGGYAAAGGRSPEHEAARAGTGPSEAEAVGPSAFFRAP